MQFKIYLHRILFLCFCMLSFLEVWHGTPCISIHKFYLYSKRTLHFVITSWCVITSSVPWGSLNGRLFCSLSIINYFNNSTVGPHNSSFVRLTMSESVITPQEQSGRRSDTRTDAGHGGGHGPYKALYHYCYRRVKRNWFLQTVHCGFATMNPWAVEKLPLLARRPWPPLRDVNQLMTRCR